MLEFDSMISKIISKIRQKPSYQRTETTNMKSFSFK